MALVWTCALFFGLFTYSFADKGIESVSSAGISESLSLTELAQDQSTIHALDHTPFSEKLPESTPEESEDSDEKEGESELEVECIQVFQKLYSKIYYKDDLSVDYLTISQLHRETIPLFILFHAWRSFIA